jgi:drug/metabolite transporter (DMT)-like permease
VLVLVFLIPLFGYRVWDRRLLQGWNLLRSGCDGAGAVCYVVGLSFLALPVAATLAWTSPILLTLLAMIVLRERVNAGRWLAVLVGFVGIVLVVQPWDAHWNGFVVLPLLAAVFGASRDLVTRYIDPQLHPLQIMLVTMVLVSLAGAVLAPFNWHPLTASHGLWVVLSALCLTLALPCLVMAIRMGELSFIAPFNFSGILVAVALGYLVWNDFPNLSMWLGIGLIVIAGVVICRHGKTTQPDEGRTTI